MYNHEQAEALQKKIVEIGLLAPVSIVRASPEKFCEVCNGIGAEWMSERSRKVITKMLSYAECSACVHDWEYHNSNGDDDRRLAVDEVFLVNGLREVRHKYPRWWNIKRWLGERAVLMAHEILTRTGSMAWREAFAKRILTTFAERGIDIDDFFYNENENESEK